MWIKSFRWQKRQVYSSGRIFTVPRFLVQVPYYCTSNKAQRERHSNGAESAKNYMGDRNKGLKNSHSIEPYNSPALGVSTCGQLNRVAQPDFCWYSPGYGSSQVSGPRCRIEKRQCSHSVIQLNKKVTYTVIKGYTHRCWSLCWFRLMWYALVLSQVSTSPLWSKVR